METAKLKKFAQFARRSLIEQVTAKLKLVLAEENPARRERPQVIKKLEDAVAEQGKAQVIEQVAYIWFNRFCALRFMDVNRYNRLGIVSPADGQFQPEILADAKMGQIDEEMVAEATRQRVFALLDGKTPSQDPQGEAYRLLVVAACNYWHSAMPFLFERIDDYTELLMPGDLLSDNSILAYTREAMTPDACEDVEVIGWLYQFYISEKKDQVFEGLKKNTKISTENIPAATQLFTPHWIVRYLVENSLGRLWMLNRPNSGLVERMDYYIKPTPAADGSEQSEADFLRINKPEEIKICDPACGSGHMLTYAFDLLYAIYEEEGYEPADIPVMILTHNLYGIEIDERAGELAAFALTMKARAKQRRFFRNAVQPNICVLENVHFDEGELNEYMDMIGHDLFTKDLRETLNQFEQAKNFGSLIVPKLCDPADTLRMVEARDFAGDLLLEEVQERVLTVLRMAEVLSSKYHVVVANPPYMGGTGMNPILKKWLSINYPVSKWDLMTAFMERAGQLTRVHGTWGIINLPSWLFLNSFEKLRRVLLTRSSISSLLHLGRGIFGSDFGSVAFVVWNARSEASGVYRRLFKKHVEVRRPEEIEELFLAHDYGRHVANQSDFLRIHGAPIAYWLTPKMLSYLQSEDRLSSRFESGGRLKTHNDNKHLRFTWEVPNNNRDHKWKELAHGGEFRRWYGNRDRVVNWSNEARSEYAEHGGLHNKKYWNKQGVTCSKITSSTNSFRLKDECQEFSSLAPTIISNGVSDHSTKVALGLLNGKVSQRAIEVFNPTVTVNVGDILAIPQPLIDIQTAVIVEDLLKLSVADWDAYETSWDFTTLPLLSPDHRTDSLEHTYTNLRAHWQGMTDEMQRLEEENNCVFIDAYGLQNELTPEVPLEEITLTCNPAYRYGRKASVADREIRLRADTIAEFLSYSVGCMFGRYALEKPGLILANQGETIEDYLKQVPEPSFPADEDNVIPMLDGDWFSDDISERFREFLRITFGEEHYEENLRFVEQALGKDIRKYFLKDFYNDHVRRYKKRPIYWLFSSPKGSFNALIYMHRYRPDTVSVVLNDYLREFRTKLTSRRDHLEAVSISASASSGEKTKALKDIEKISKVIVELDDYERDVLYPLATKQVEIDLDDGVKVNYPKFGSALKKIAGIDSKGEGN
ncbi:BREX-1 system adenine-specific DNA-methyltransferase PglX [Marinobacter sp. S6332]|uniref:BREX-1 system adenine-specific DNA-methyltransferase PglX n=1 Tax=Marinobacter sp. S6332 TaxID=2926403 RepID=UPI001FF5A540|nr:BREX-1 system adenine-specific DNA-methyltransferase PglX [Marinobacter sp. S6332]MCK0165746.1 BREX-1 system adenine-specific DNA-methyltransferase PglX [Marinobacter sp. S6332]